MTAEQERINALEAALWKFAEVARHIEVRDPDDVVLIDDRVPEDSVLRVKDFTEALDLLLKKEAEA
jgi:hypothetical protein